MARPLRVEYMLGRFGKDVREQMHKYRLYVEEGLMREVENPADASQVRSILGSDTFVEWIRREFILQRVKGVDEQAELRRLQSGFGFDAVLDAAAAATGVRASVLRTRRCRDRRARDLLAALVRRYCRNTLLPSAQARAMGLSYSGLVHAGNRGLTQAAAGDHAWGKAVSLLASNFNGMGV